MFSILKSDQKKKVSFHHLLIVVYNICYYIKLGFLVSWDRYSRNSSRSCYSFFKILSVTPPSLSLSLSTSEEKHLDVLFWMDTSQLRLFSLIPPSLSFHSNIIRIWPLPRAIWHTGQYPRVFASGGETTFNIQYDRLFKNSNFSFSLSLCVCGWVGDVGC